ncbi:cilia- and flagella-associated protein 57-like isoform X2 [Diaphorina citri]|uniref:Cilia- and flagella-associated protein 57-like isoform X2 n=1 Tax=Diaphorina citri TaxID=121845 RepID=A0A3Q0JCD4_DIACI|nr:cilia- and flagella-associated protein 57-like isoform X2 [Diaphorina citri]
MYISREIGVLTQLGPKVHYKAITGVDMSWHKNRVVSVSEDRQLCVWNAKTGESELCEKYNMDVIGVTMDQTGFYLYIGFSHKVNFCMLRYKTLTMKRSFDLMPCSRIRFSVTGSYVALVNNLDVLVLDNIYFEPVHVLSGNTSRITKLAWSYKDDYLVSCAADGSIIQWKLSTEDRRKCLTLENVKFVDIALSFCRDVLVAVGNSPYIYTLDLGSMEIKISPGNDMLVTGTIRGTLAFWSIHVEGATRIKVPIPVTLIEKHVLMSYVKTIEEFTITLNNIHFVFDKKMNLLERSLANEYEEERKQYEAETKRKQRHLSQLVRCNNKERSALKTELRTLKNNNRSRRERLQIEFCEEFVQQALKVKQLQLEIQLGSQQYERKREQIMEHFEQEKNKEMRMFNLEQDKKKTYMNHLEDKVLQIQDRLLSKIRKQFQLKDCLAEVSNKLIPSHKKLVHLESEIDSTLQDLSDMLFKPPKLSQKCNDPQDFHRRVRVVLTKTSCFPCQNN